MSIPDSRVTTKLCCLQKNNFGHTNLPAQLLYNDFGDVIQIRA